jgi:D-alanyl-D-alanine carboxypeptidase
VTVNGVRIIDEWHGSPTIATYTRDVTLFTGLNSFVIEYYEESGVARIGYNISSLSQPSQPTTGVPMVTINTPLLNVRSAPFIGDNIINKVPRGATYIVVGRNADSSWWQIQIGAQVGWVSGAYVIPANTQNVPVVTVSVEVPNSPSVGTGYFLRSTANLNIRAGAGTNFSRINILPNGTQAEILGRNSSNTWWLISYGGTTGWVSGAFVTLPTGIDLNRIPIR